MILQSEILRISEQEGVPPDTIDKNWVLGHFLAELFTNSWAQENLVFKGGTCLKKCYFEDYRFSEDLDFTLLNKDIQVTDRLLQSVCNAITQKIGILFSKVKVDAIMWKDMQVGYKTYIKFWGANHNRNHRPPASGRWLTEIKIEIVNYELVVNDPVRLPILTFFSDKATIDSVRIPCYTLTEVIAEKFRSLLQRSYPAPRDYYDLWKLLQDSSLTDWGSIVPTFHQKIEFKNIIFNNYNDFFDEIQINKMKQAWNNSLKGHLKEDNFPTVEIVVNDLKKICSQVDWNLKK